MDSTSCMGTQWPKVKCSVSQRGNRYQQRIAGLCFKILMTCTAMHLQGPAKGSKQHPYLPWTLQAAVDLLGHKAQTAEQLAQQPRPVAEPSPVLGSIQNQQLFLSLSNGQHTQMSNVLPSKSKETHQALYLFFGCRRGRKNTFLTLGRTSPHTPHCWIPRNFTPEIQVECPQIFFFIFVGYN